MNEVEETSDGKIYIDGVEIKKVKTIKRFFDLSGCGVEISFYTRNYISPNGKSKMTKQQAEKAIMQILKQYEIDNKTVVDNVYIDDKDISNYGERQKILRKAIIHQRSLSESNWDL